MEKGFGLFPYSQQPEVCLVVSLQTKNVNQSQLFTTVLCIVSFIISGGVFNYNMHLRFHRQS